MSESLKTEAVDMTSTTAMPANMKIVRLYLEWMPRKWENHYTKHSGLMRKITIHSQASVDWTRHKTGYQKISFSKGRSYVPYLDMLLH